MTNYDLEPPTTTAPPASRAMCADSVGRTLLAMSVPPDRRSLDEVRHVPVLGRRGELPEAMRRPVLAADAVEQAVPVEQAGLLDAGAVAAWIVRHHAGARFPAVVLGSPHGAAVHLAAACGAAWLPTSFTVTVPWPDGSAGDWTGAMAWGSHLAGQIMAGNPAVTVRQTHDPVLRGPLSAATVSLHVRWRTVPEAYQRFLTSQLLPGALAVLVRDLRTWPALDGPQGYSFQIGSPVSGWKPADHSPRNAAFQRLLARLGAGAWPDFPVPLRRHYAETSGEPAFEQDLRRFAVGAGLRSHRILYSEAQALSAGVADLYQAWLRPSTGARHCAVVTGRMTDPWEVLRCGMVPYWCESSSRSATEAAEWWLAGSRPFDSISVLPDPPGIVSDDTAHAAHWRGLARFARRHGEVDRLVTSRYPLLPPPVGHASRHLADAASESGNRRPLPADEALRRLKRTGPTPGLLVL